jgi:outer membrane protein
VQLIHAQNDYEIAKALLNRAMGVEEDTAYDVTEEGFPALDGEDKSTEELLIEAQKARPEFAALASQVRAQELTVQVIERARYSPTLSAQTGMTEAGTPSNGLGWNWNIGLLLNWPIYQGGLSVAQLAEAHATLNGLSAALDINRQQIRLQLEQARLAVSGAKASLEATEDANINARERLKLAEGRYAAGVGNAIELGDAQLALTNALAQQVQAEHDLATARVGLLLALGRR